MPTALTATAADTRPATPLTLVLDTNIVLDWLVFRDPTTIELQRAVTEHRAHLITHQPALEELRRVLAYPQFRLDPPAQQEVLRQYQSATTIVSLPADFTLEHLMLPATFPRCRDRDDEHFLALAYHARADALVTKDKVVLRLGERSLRFGVTILSPAQLAAKLDDIAR